MLETKIYVARGITTRRVGSFVLKHKHAREPRAVSVALAAGRYFPGERRARTESMYNSKALLWAAQLLSFWFWGRGYGYFLCFIGCIVQRYWVWSWKNTKKCTSRYGVTHCQCDPSLSIAGLFLLDIHIVQTDLRPRLGQIRFFFLQIRFLGWLSFRLQVFQYIHY